MKRFMLFLAAFLLVTFLLCQPTILADSNQSISLVKYDSGFFSVMLPEGWRITTMGQYSEFGFRAWNPQNPAYEIFYYLEWCEQELWQVVNRRDAFRNRILLFSLAFTLTISGSPGIQA